MNKKHYCFVKNISFVQFSCHTSDKKNLVSNFSRSTVYYIQLLCVLSVNPIRIHTISCTDNQYGEGVTYQYYSILLYTLYLHVRFDLLLRFLYKPHFLMPGHFDLI